MMATAQEAPTTDSRQVIDKCVECARAEGIADCQSDRRISPRMPFVHPVRYCLGSSVTEECTQPGYVLDISRDGMGMRCRQGLPLAEQIWLRLPLSDGTLVWLHGEVMYCEPDVEHYRAGIAFTG